jgi:hypothetical protein
MTDRLHSYPAQALSLARHNDRGTDFAGRVLTPATVH